MHRSQKSHFNPLPPHGGRLGATNTTSTSRTFQSTPSAWRETRLSRNFFRFFPFQSTPSAWRETQRLGKSPEPKIFQSTPSAWRETFCSALVKAFCGISIHSLRMEGDFLFFAEIVLHWEFQSTPSAWRETTWRRIFCGFWDISIHSLRMEGDLTLSRDDAFLKISIHSLRMEGDSRKTLIIMYFVYFNPLPPHGGRHL